MDARPQISVDEERLRQLARSGENLKDSSLRKVWRVSHDGCSRVLKEVRIRGLAEHVRALWLRSRVLVEARNLETARARDLPCPEPLLTHVAAGPSPSIGWLLLDDLGDGMAVDAALRQLPRAARLDTLERCSDLLARCFENGLRHRDLHLGNLWRRADGELFLLDLHAARFTSVPVRPTIASAHKLYLSLPWPEDAPEREALFSRLPLPAHPDRLERWRQRHLDRRVRRAMRPSGAFRRLADPSWALVRRGTPRAWTARDWRAAISDAIAAGRVLKSGRRGRVVRASLGDHDFVGKSRREAAAIDSWRSAEALALRGLGHAPSLAILRSVFDDRNGDMFWVLAETVEGDDLARTSASTARLRRLARHFGRYMGRVHATRLRCRDARLDNFRVVDDEFVLLDLDGVAPMRPWRRSAARAGDLGRALAWLRFQAPEAVREQAQDLARRTYIAWLREQRRLMTKADFARLIGTEDRFRRAIEVRCTKWRTSHRNTNDPAADGSASVDAPSP